MVRLINIVVLAASLGVVLQGQSLQLSTSINSVLPGQSIGVNVGIQDTTRATAVQWTLAAPNGWLVQTPTLGNPALSKQVTCSLTSCILYGYNLIALPIGGLATIPITIPANTAPGQYVLSLTNTLGVDAGGSAISLTGTPLTIAVGSKYDMNGDGQVTLSDVNAVITAILENMAHSTLPGVADLDGDGKATVADFGIELGQWIAAGSKP